MTDDFKIDYRWQAKANPQQPYADDDNDWPELYQCLYNFLSLYEGEFSLQIDDLKLEFQLFPDFLAVFEDLPEQLQKLIDSEQPAYLDFFSQGTDLVLILQADEQELQISFECGPSAPQEWGSLSGIQYCTLLDGFIQQWKVFVQAVLSAALDTAEGDQRAAVLAYLEKVKQLQS